MPALLVGRSAGDHAKAHQEAFLLTRLAKSAARNYDPRPISNLRKLRRLRFLAPAIPGQIDRELRFHLP